MNVSDLRKRIIRALDDARKESAERRASVDLAGAEYETFLNDVAVPLFKQAATVLRGEGHPFSANTPAGSVRLVSDHSPDDFLELELGNASGQPQVIGRTSVRTRRGLEVEERPVAAKAIRDITEDDVAALLIDEVRKLVAR
jgi:hypothetical protein